MVYIPSKIRQKAHAYPTALIRMNCFVDIAGYFAGTNDPMKEMSESLGLFKAAEAGISDFTKLRKERNVAVIVVGDGTTPRTASLFAVLTRWTVFSIDPRMRVEKKDTHKLDRLNVIKSTLENFPFESSGVFDFDYRVLVYPHSHADFTLGVNLTKPTWAFTMPCCFVERQTLQPSLLEMVNLGGERVYKDDKVMSPHNRIFSYKFSEV